MKNILNRYSYSGNEELGRGAFGRVYKGVDSKTNKSVAIKIMNLDGLQDQQMIENFKQEMSIMKEFNHPNIVKLLDFQMDPQQNIVVFDYCEGGDLSKFLDKKGSMLDEQAATQILIQIFNGFREVIAKGYIHRDVKPANILIQNGIFKLADFGFATKVAMNEILDQQVGTPLYMAPQLLENTPYTSKCDIWSLGIIAYEMIYGRQPWSCRDMKSYLKNIKCYPLRFPIDKAVSEQYKNFVRLCLKIDENQRIGWKDLFEHSLLDTRQLTQKTFKIIQIDDETKQILRNIQYIAQTRQLKIQEQFNKYDIDKEGNLDFNEFFQFILKIDPSITSNETSKLFNFLDQQKKQKINLNEFQILFSGNDFSDLKNFAQRIIQDLKEIIANNKLNVDQIFHFYDEDKEGDLKLDEFSNLILRIAPALKPKEILIVFTEFDKDNNNSISLEEFKKIICPQGQNYEKLKLQKLQQELVKQIKNKNLTIENIFKTFNISKTNKMNYEEFATLCRDLVKVITDNEIQQVFKTADKNQDQFIRYEEFINFFK
ncbi:unnamed protein product [Paramecium pentaurelia]|uniref:Calcium-dependent protein kinase n=1 Tax=Paramecium pentaurelia TaxID=43138 RepID=A0A8S1YFV5_9CILI|nr:unnamed protein product [Paramecium pentaurelia]